MTVHPLELRDKLDGWLTGQILQDILVIERGRVRPGTGHLSACCGREVEAVRWVRGNGHIWLWLETPQLPDEPPGLFVPATDVTRVRGGPYWVTLWHGSRRRIQFGIAPVSARAQYDAPAFSDEHADLFRRAMANSGKVTIASTSATLGIPHRHAERLVSAWERQGWLYRYGHTRYVSEAGAEMANGT